MRHSKSDDFVNPFNSYDNYTLQYEIERRSEAVEREKAALKRNLLFIKEAKQELKRRENKKRK